MLSELEILCLNEIADDYEEIPQIKLQLREAAKFEASLEEITTSLFVLVASGLANCYAYDESKQGYVTASYDAQTARLPVAAATWHPGEDVSSRLWFYITEEGKKLVEGLPDDWQIKN